MCEHKCGFFIEARGIARADDRLPLSNFDEATVEIIKSHVRRGVLYLSSWHEKERNPYLGKSILVQGTLEMSIKVSRAKERPFGARKEKPLSGLDPVTFGTAGGHSNH